MGQVLLSASPLKHSTKVIIEGNRRASDIKVISPKSHSRQVEAIGFQPRSDDSQTSVLHHYLLSQNAESICPFYKQEVMEVSLQRHNKSLQEIRVNLGIAGEQ